MLHWKGPARIILFFDASDVNKFARKQTNQHNHSPQWLLQLWLHLYMHKVAVRDLKNLNFPSSDYSEDQHKTQQRKTRRCLSFGEASSAISIPLHIGHFFKGFYNGFSNEVIIWFAYPKDNEFELPYKF